MSGIIPIPRDSFRAPPGKVVLAPTMAGASPIVTIISWTDFSLKSISYLRNCHYLWWRDQERRVVSETAGGVFAKRIFCRIGGAGVEGLGEIVDGGEGLVGDGLAGAGGRAASTPAGARRRPTPRPCARPTARRGRAPPPGRGRRLLLRDTLSLAHQYPHISW